MKITVHGSGDAFGTGGRFNTCIEVATGGDRLLLDCGSSSMTALNKAAVARNTLSTLLFTHFHGDHFGALPAFLLDAHFISRRKEKLTIAGPKGIRERTAEYVSRHFPGLGDDDWRFPVEYVEVTPEAPASLSGLDVAAFQMRHEDRAGPCQGYRIGAGGKVFAYSGDTAWTDSLIGLADGADAMLCECYAWDIELANHLDYATIARRRAELRTDRLILTHMGANMLAHDEPLPEQRASDGMVIEL